MTFKMKSSLPPLATGWSRGLSGQLGPALALLGGALNTLPNLVEAICLVFSESTVRLMIVSSRIVVKKRETHNRHLQ